MAKMAVVFRCQILPRSDFRSISLRKRGRIRTNNKKAIEIIRKCKMERMIKPRLRKALKRVKITTSTTIKKEESNAAGVTNTKTITIEKQTTISKIKIKRL